MQTTVQFDAMGIEVAAFLAGNNRHLMVDDRGFLQIPDGIEPASFKLSIWVPKDARIVLAQKDPGHYDGRDHAVVRNRGNDGDFVRYITRQPIRVKRDGKYAHTVWRDDDSNRVKVWGLGQSGHIAEFQTGIVTPDRGARWHLIGITRFAGQVYRDGKEYVVRPDHPKWGSFGRSRWSVFDYQPFIQLLNTATIPTWTGKEEELSPQLPKVPAPKFAVVQFFSPFMGEGEGQGPVNLHDGRTAWIHGGNLECSVGSDDVKLLNCGDILSYEGMKPFGDPKKGGMTLLNAQKVKV